MHFSWGLFDTVGSTKSKASRWYAPLCVCSKLHLTWNLTRNHRKFYAAVVWHTESMHAFHIRLCKNRFFVWVFFFSTLNQIGSHFGVFAEFSQLFVHPFMAATSTLLWFCVCILLSSTSFCYLRSANKPSIFDKHKLIACHFAMGFVADHHCLWWSDLCSKCKWFMCDAMPHLLTNGK